MKISCPRCKSQRCGRVTLSAERVRSRVCLDCGTVRIFRPKLKVVIFFWTIISIFGVVVLRAFANSIWLANLSIGKAAICLGIALSVGYVLFLRVLELLPSSWAIGENERT